MKDKKSGAYLFMPDGQAKVDSMCKQVTVSTG